MRGKKRVKVRLSISQHNKGVSCGRAWKYHYVDKLRPENQSSALLFGTAVETGINALILGKSDEEVLETFDRAWNFQKINGKVEPLPKNLKLAYAESDFDEDLFEPEDLQKITEQYGVENHAEAFTKIYEEKKYFGYDGLPADRREFLNYINWLCLYRKALYIFDAVKIEFLPLVEEVLSVQEEIELLAYDENGNPTGDSIIGYIDMVLRLKGYKKPIVFDWKTSSREYEDDSVKFSLQLAVYLHAVSDKYENTRQAGYGVLLKKIKMNTKKTCLSCGADKSNRKGNLKTCDEMINGKRCHGKFKIENDPKAQIQILIDEIPEITELDILENMAAFNQMVKNGVFIKNYDACVKPWGKCPYFGMCREGKGMEGLVKVEESKRDENVPLAANSG
jgi:hypothetical protein